MPSSGKSRRGGAAGRPDIRVESEPVVPSSQDEDQHPPERPPRRARKGNAQKKQPLPEPADEAQSVRDEARVAGPAVQPAVTLELIPGASLGPFHLGMGVTSTLDRVRDEYVTFAHLEIVYDEAALPTSDILLQLPALGICLRFEPVHQQLRRIDFWPSESLTILYKSRVVLEPGTPALFEATRHMFGPSDGEFDRGTKTYLLRYPGVTLGFEVPMEVQRQHAKNPEVDLQRDGRFAGGSAGKLCCGAVVSGVDLKGGPPAGAPLDRVRTMPGLGLLFEDGRRALFGDTSQEIVSKFGPPCTAFRPVDSAWIGGDEEAAGVFFNYRRLGIDVFFDPKRHRAVKFVLHSNVPGHYDFGVYTKCNFACEIRAAPLTKGTVDAHAEAMLRSCIDLQPRVVSSGGGLRGLAATADDHTEDSFRTLSDELSTGWDSGSDENLADLGSLSRNTSSGRNGGPHPLSHGSAGSSTMLVTPETKWEQVVRLFKVAKPVAMQPPPAANTVNPFGPTHLYNDGPFVFETVPQTGRIATVTFTQQPL
eukprot:m.457583 g.457583  ORF g.457583 m.457583 type:complete len:535 (-) comp21299_c0_seq1:250-1854(-)